MYMENFNLSNILKQEIKKCVDPQYDSLVLLEIPPLPQFGEFSSNIAMVLAKHLKKSPAIIAKEIKEKLEKSLEFSKYFEAVIPGNSAYINFYIRAELFPDLVRGIVSSNAFGRGEKKNKKILLEFLSANPTGPMHLGNGRGGFTGDCLANVLQWAGYDVWREYYVNDTGNQVINLGKSIMAASRFYKEQ
ncbi:arginine--tRNA ligase, partial [Patescibacteria group bacterium]